MIVQLWKKTRKDGEEIFASLQQYGEGFIVYYEETKTILSPAPLAELEQALRLAGYQYLVTQEIF